MLHFCSNYLLAVELSAQALVYRGVERLSSLTGRTFPDAE